MLRVFFHILKFRNVKNLFDFQLNFVYLCAVDVNEVPHFNLTNTFEQVAYLLRE